MDGPEPLIEMHGIRFGYAPESLVHDGLDFRLVRGQRLGVVGPNGAGKTTLFHLAVGLLRPLAGRIVVLGRQRAAEQDFWEVRQRVGLLFQDPDDQLFCPTVGEDVAFGPLNLGRSRPEARQIVERTLHLLGLDHLEQRITHHLSGGEKRLVALAAVLAMEPEALLLDEPAAGLAEDVTDRLVHILHEHVETCAIISHDRAFLGRCTDQVIEIRDGKAMLLRREEHG